VDSLIQELHEIRDELKTFINKATARTVTDALDVLERSAKEVGRAWSGSWFGYQANVYYEALKPPPPGRHFSSEWGFIDALSSGTYGDWIEYDSEDVKTKIEELAKHPNLEPAIELAGVGKELFNDKRDQIVSILEVTKSQYDDSFINDLLEHARKLYIVSESEIISNNRPQQILTRDSLAYSQGFWTPPHIAILARVLSLRFPVETNRKLAEVVQKAANHINRLPKKAVKTMTVTNRVFIGHGRSPLWKDLQYFIQNRLNLEWDEFNRIAVAGKTTVDRLSEMLDAATIAFLVLTAEDERADGTMQARMNVIHELGLFQGKLGFTKAIILLEEDCEEFSNIHGLNQLRFPKENIKAVFEDIRLVLEREGILAN
jgi:predicted nucleotide-binding protein